jgi:hypothetical protein
MKHQLPSKGWGPWRYEWYSICSGHASNIYPVDPNCNRCMSGKWVNVWAHKIEHVIYTLAPWLWIRWVNRPRGKKKFLASFQKFDG